MPDMLGIEREEEFDRRACEKRGENGVYGAMDVMEGEHVKEVIRRRIFPSFYERLSLCSHNGLGEKNSFLVFVSQQEMII